MENVVNGEDWMKRKPRYGPQPGERVRVKNVPCGYPLTEGLKDGDVVLLKEWTGAYYIARRMLWAANEGDVENACAKSFDSGNPKRTVET